MKMGLTKARAQYISAIEDTDVQRWLEADILHREEVIDLPEFHGSDFANVNFFTDAAKLKLVSRFKSVVMETPCTKSASELQAAWDKILTAHGVEATERKALYSYPSLRQAISKNDYSILHQSGNLNDIWGSLSDLLKRDIKAAFIAYASNHLIPTTTLLKDYRDALEKFELIIPVPQQNLYDLGPVQQHRYTDTQDRIWSSEGVELLKRIFNGAVNSSWNYDDLRTLSVGFINLDLLGQAENQKLRMRFLNLPYNKMRAYSVDMPLLNIAEDERNQRLSEDFSQNPVAAWKKHGLQPFDDGIIIADSISSARDKLVASLRNSSSAGIEEYRPLIKALQAEHDIEELQQTKWFDKNIFSLGKDEALAFLEFFNGLTLGDERRTPWLSKALQDAAEHTFQKLWREHRAFFTAGLLQTSQFHDKFHSEINGKSFETIVKEYDLEWLDAQLGLTSPQDRVVLRAVGRFLLTSLQLPVNLTQPNAHLTALETHGFFSEGLKQLITTASTDIHEANEELRQAKQRCKDAFNQTMHRVEEQCKESTRQAQEKWNTAQLYVNTLSQSVQKAEEVERLSKLLAEASSSKPALEEEVKTALAEVTAASIKKPQGDADNLRKTLREHNKGITAQQKQKSLETDLALLQKKLPAVQSAANQSREEAATNTTAFAALSLAVKGNTDEESELRKLTSQIAAVQENLQKATAEAKLTQSAIQSEQVIRPIREQLKIFDAYASELNGKIRRHENAQAALAKCEKDMQSYRQSIDNLKRQLDSDSLATKRQKLAKAESEAKIAQSDYEKVVAQAELSRQQTQTRACVTQEHAINQAKEQYQAFLKRKQGEVSSAIQNIYGLD